MEVIITLATESTMGKATTSDKKTLPQLIHEAVDTFNELHDENFTFEGMEFKRTDEEEDEIQARKDSGDLIPLGEWFIGLRDNDPERTFEEAEALLADVEIHENIERERVVEFMRRMPDQFAIDYLIYNIAEWNEHEVQLTGNSDDSVAAPEGDDA